MSADPTAEHIDAVARSISTREWGEWSSAHHADFNRWTWDGDGPTDLERAEFRDYADAILTSTDPAVHAALAASLPAEVMLAALVDRGTLGEEPWRVKCLCGKTMEGSPDEVSAWTRAHDDSPKASHIVVWDPPSGKPWTRRHVTRGEVAP